MLFRKKNELTAAEQMLNYMKEKYQEDFTPGLCAEASWAYSYDSMTVYSEKFPGEFIKVYRYEKKTFKDNYMSFLFREEIEKIVHEIVEPLFGRCRVIMHLSNLPDGSNLTKEATLDDYLKNCCCLSGFYVYLEEYDPSKDYMVGVETLRLQFKNKLLPRAITFMFLKPDKCLDEITRETESRVLNKFGSSSWYIKSADFCFSENYDFDMSEMGQL